MRKLKSRDLDLDHQQGGGITQLEQKWELSDNQNSSQLHHNYYQSFVHIQHISTVGLTCKVKVPKICKIKVSKIGELAEVGRVGSSW